MSSRLRSARTAAAHAALASCALLPGLAARAQGTTVVMGGKLRDAADATVGSEEENYLRLLQVAGLARQRPWSLRPFGPDELPGLVADSVRHPWAGQLRLAQHPATRVARTVGADVGVAVNTGFPYSINDGAIWAGRGPTVYARGGVFARYGIFSVRLEPTAFWASNLSTPIAPNGQSGAQRYGDALAPAFIDNPQRFGSRPYARFDPGQSTVRADAFGLTAGLTTANEWIGPTLQDPLIMGDNAAGMPRFFVGTSKPLNVGVGTIHARLEAGRLAQSAYSPMPADSADRLGTMFTIVGTIRGVPGLEVGATRFIHEFWPGLSHVASRLGAPFGGIFAPTSVSQGPIEQNELASAFARWVLTPARVEVWGEYMRNDFAANSRDLLVEPDHDAGWVVGARRVWIRRDGGLTALRFETLNTLITHLDRIRLQVRPYEHTPIRQGHTELGEVLGSFSGEGGLATTVGLDRYRRDGRWTFEYARRVRQSSLGEGAPVDQWDVYHVLRAERLRFGTGRDLFTGAAVVAELNRNFVHDAYALRLDAGWRFGARPASR